MSPHAQAKLLSVGCGGDETAELLKTGIVLSYRERDELKTAIDGYKHFLSAITRFGAILEIVFKIVRADDRTIEEVVILITVLRGSV